MFTQAFKPGDIVRYREGYGVNGEEKMVAAEVIGLRMAVGNTRTGELSPVADLLLANGKVTYVFLTYLAKWNAERLAHIKEGAK